ncbi:anthranilate phosphoribosyltransferase [Luteibaculum oceani]|uniref:Anthranilate phosphoribosyltransferase n=1 Tax=Luteibaculum oceani TaxID=1294296 RepID=A0A5C6V1L4_9FLAO|nr:anthranilate phosphoribosyltransferase [Luteibaculum oceani]TXC78561.1 anthranilate phosphoribosyltransferase [Luteibaculum oceani]
MKLYLQKVFQHQFLTKEEAKSAMEHMASGEANEIQMAAFVAAMMMRPMDIHELEGFREALLELCVRVDLNQGDCIDLCGTGGDGKNTFNISTLSSFVAAGAGIPVTKHGNYGVSSVSGSSNVLEHLGITFTADPNKLQEQLDKAGICFLHAPKFHPALKNVAGVRKSLGVKTFFNILGPMVNPAFPKKQLVGVFNLEVARNYQYIFQNAGKSFMVLHALDGYDEISGTGPVKFLGNQSEGMFNPSELIGRNLAEEELHAGDSVEDAAKIFMDVLNNSCTEAQKAVVACNAGAAIKTYYPNVSWEDAYSLSMESIESGKAISRFEKLKELSQ